MMDTALIILLIIIVIGIFYKFLNYRGKNSDNQNYNRNLGHYDRGEKRQEKSKKSEFSLFQQKTEKTEVKAKNYSFFARIFSKPLSFDDESVTWCANLLAVEKEVLVNILKDISAHYTHFKIGKRSGGYRIISAPNQGLKKIQKTIYSRILLPVNIHPAATGFRPSISIINNAKVHLGKGQVLKIDITNFFGAIKKFRVVKAFNKIGYPSNISEVLAELCTLDKKLPQGAPTSPSLSNIIAYDIDVKLTDLSQKYNISYTRYADDLTFSGLNISFDTIVPEINKILYQSKFIIQRKKTRYLTEKKRKIITGISVSSGEKLTIPKSTKREIRKNVYFILSKGLYEHQKFIGSTDPSYLKRIVGQLNFWRMVEPDNEYVKKSIAALKKL